MSARESDFGAANDFHADNPLESTELFARLVDDDAAAADEVFRRYADRLMQLVQVRMSAKLRTRLDADDVVMSAYRSFFVAARAGKFTIERGGDLWRLLLQLTLHKLYRQAAKHTAARRSIHEESSSIDGSQADWIASREPSPDVAAALLDEVERLVAELPELGRRVVELRLQGFEIEEIATQVNRNERTVRRMLDRAKTILARMNPDVDALADIKAPRAKGRASLPARTKSEPKTRRKKSTQVFVSHDEIEQEVTYSDFLLTRLIGSGAMGKVYRAVRRSDGSSVAIKFLRLALLNRESLVRRFVDEATLVSQLHHPGIVGIHGMGRSPRGGLFLVLELVPGGDLAQQITRGPVAVEDALRWVREAAEAISYVHQQGIVHCDLKPGNLLLDDQGHVRVTDFGFARMVGPNYTAANFIAGTPAFMAPEQLDARWGPLGPHTDVFGLGGVLLCLLTSRPPFDGKTVDGVLQQVASSERICVPEPWRNTIPKPVIELIESCLQKHPQQRPSSAAEVAQRLNPGNLYQPAAPGHILP